jgi:hypothetical protein
LLSKRGYLEAILSKNTLGPLGVKKEKYEYYLIYYPSIASYTSYTIHRIPYASTILSIALYSYMIFTYYHIYCHRFIYNIHIEPCIPR